MSLFPGHFCSPSITPSFFVFSHVSLTFTQFILSLLAHCRSLFLRPLHVYLPSSRPSLFLSGEVIVSRISHSACQSPRVISSECVTCRLNLSALTVGCWPDVWVCVQGGGAAIIMCLPGNGVRVLVYCIVLYISLFGFVLGVVECYFSWDL